MASELIMAKTPREAAAAKKAGAVFIAGGTEANRLGSDIAEKAETLISLRKCGGLSDIRREDGFVTVGSMCTFQQIKESDDVPGYLREAACFMASRTKRNMATIGGNIASARDDSYMIPTLIAAGAVVELMGEDAATERLGTEEYLEAGEDSRLIVSVTVPADAAVLAKRYSNTAQSHAVITMAASKDDDRFVLAAAVKNSGIFRLTDFEKAVSADPSMSEDEMIGWFKAYKNIPMEDDMFGSVSYKRYLLGVTAADMYHRLMD